MKKRNPQYFRVISLVVLIFLLAGGSGYAQSVPSPEEFLGFKVGADFHLITYDQALAYFQALDEASPRLKIIELGKTEMGRPMIAAIISSAENMKKLDAYKKISTQLAMAKSLTDEEARKLAYEGKAVVYIDGGLHATECAPAQHNVQLAYDLITNEDPMTQGILENVILLLVFAGPDHRNDLHQRDNWLIIINSLKKLIP